VSPKLITSWSRREATCRVDLAYRALGSPGESVVRDHGAALDGCVGEKKTHRRPGLYFPTVFRRWQRNRWRLVFVPAADAVPLTLRAAGVRGRKT
jgi:hypothetical protein